VNNAVFLQHADSGYGTVQKKIKRARQISGSRYGRSSLPLGIQKIKIRLKNHLTGFGKHGSRLKGLRECFDL
jgi:hypothetical protein